MLYTCVKTIKAVTARRFCSISCCHHTLMARCDSFPGNKNQAKITAGLRWHEHHRPLAMLQCTVHTLTAFSHVLLLVSPAVCCCPGMKEIWATILSGSCADHPLSQWQLRNRVSPRRLPVEGAQSCVTDADNAAVHRAAYCTPLSDYDKSNSECQKIEFEFEFINQNSNFQTSFKIHKCVQQFLCLKFAHH